MEGNKKYSTSQFLNLVPDSYFERTSRPVYAIVFLLPFIIFYELGTVFIKTDLLSHYWQGRVVAFLWLQKFLEWLGFGSKFAWAVVPLAVVVILVALQLTSHKRWRFWPGDILPMSIECTLLAVPLVVLSLFLSSSVERRDDVSRLADSPMQFCSDCRVVFSDLGFNRRFVTGCSSVQVSSTESKGQPGKWEGLAANIVSGIGAGIYEELVFRLILICVLMALFQDVLRLNHRNSIISAVLISAAFFSAHHHIDFLTGQLNPVDQFNWAKFGFRTIAGIYFAGLFAIRGFGITAGTHAFYDIIAVFINTLFFQP